MPKAKRIATICMTGMVAGRDLTTPSIVVKTMMAAVATRKGTAGRA